MAIALPRPPNPIPPSVPRYDTTGRPERVQVEYENRVHQFLAEVDDAINAPPPPAPPPPPTPVNVYNAGVTLSLVDQDAYCRFNLPLTGTVGLQSDAVVNFPIGTRIEIEQMGIGAAQLSWAGGVTVNTARTPPSPIQTTGQYTRMIMRKVAANTWVVF